MELFRRERGAVNPVLADAAARHDDQVAGDDFLRMCGFAVETGRHDPGGAAVNEGLAEIPLVEDDAAVDRGNAALVAAVLDALANALVDAARMQDAFGQRLCVIGRRETEDIGIENQFGAFPGAEGIAVDADDARERPAVGIKRRGRIVRFHLEDQVVVVIEFDDAGVVHKNGQAPVLLAEAFADIFCRCPDMAVEERVDLKDLTRFIPVSNETVEYLVLAVFRPGLCEAFQLHVRYFRTEADLFSFFDDGSVLEVIANDPHFVEGQGQYPLPADLHELPVADIEVDLFDRRCIDAGDARHISGHSRLTFPCFAVDNLVVFDEIVGKQAGGDSLRVLRPDRAADQVLTRRINLRRIGERQSQQQGDGLVGGLAHIVGDAGPESHLDHPVETVGQGAVNGKLLDNGIGQRAGGYFFQALRGKQAVDGIDVDRPDFVHGDMQIFDDASFYFFSEGVPDTFFKADFNSMGHAFSFLIQFLDFLRVHQFGKRQLFLP